MKIALRHIGNKKYTIVVSQGVQSFRLHYEGTKKNCEWYIKMLRRAFKRHDTETIDRFLDKINK